MTACTQQDYQRTGQQDAGQVTASKDDLDREYNDGAERGSQDVAKDAADGHSAGAREARHMERSGPAPDREQGLRPSSAGTPATAVAATAPRACCANWRRRRANRWPPNG